jgi:hypothetical protein
MMLLVIFQALYIPVSVAWQINLGEGWGLDYIVDTLFISDLFMSFNLAYRPHPQADLVTDRKLIAINYFKLWFWIDLVASVPFDKLAAAFQDQGSGEQGASSALGLLKGLRLPRLLRLLKIVRILKIIRMMNIRPELMWWIQYSRHANLFKLFWIIIVLIIFVHYVACIFQFIVGTNEPGENTWFQRTECDDVTNTDRQVRPRSPFPPPPPPPHPFRRPLTPPNPTRPQLRLEADSVAREHCLTFRDFYTALIPERFGFAPETLDQRLKDASERVLNATMDEMVAIINLYGNFCEKGEENCAEDSTDLDDCFLEEDPMQSCDQADFSMSYTTAYYNSMLLIMGESIGPGLTSEKWFATIVILTGSVVIASIYGSVSMYISNYTANTTAYQRKMELLYESMMHLQLPPNLKKRILMYYDHIWKEYRTLDGTISYFIPELSKQVSPERRACPSTLTLTNKSSPRFPPSCPPRSTCTCARTSSCPCPSSGNAPPRWSANSSSASRARSFSQPTTSSTRARRAPRCF